MRTSSSRITVMPPLAGTKSSPEMLSLTLSTPSRMQVRTTRAISCVPSATMAKLSRIRCCLFSSPRPPVTVISGLAARMRGPGTAARVDFVAHHHVQAQLGAGRAVGAGEAGVEQLPRVVQGLDHVFLGRDVAEVGVLGGAAERQVRVALDQARHQRHAQRIDHVDAFGRALGRTALHGADAVALDQHLGGKRCGAGAVPELAIANQGRHREGLL